MKYLILVPDGAGDEPVEALGGKTPLEAADIPMINELAAKGKDHSAGSRSGIGRGQSVCNGIRSFRVSDRKISSGSGQHRY